MSHSPPRSPDHIGPTTDASHLTRRCHGPRVVRRAITRAVGQGPAVLLLALTLLGTCQLAAGGAPKTPEVMTAAASSRTIAPAIPTAEPRADHDHTQTTALRLDAETAAQMAIARSAKHRAAERAVDAAAFAVRAADAARLPTVDSSITLQQRSSVPELEAPLLGAGQPLITIFPNIQTATVAGITARQPLYTSGATPSRRMAARHGLEASRWSKARTIDLLRLEGRLAYWQTAAALAAQSSAEAELQRARRLLEDADAMHSVGMAVDADVLAATARVELSRVELTRATNAYRQSMASLCSLLELRPRERVEIIDTARLPAPSEPEPMRDLISQALSGRPELAEISAEIDRLTAQAEALAATTRPSVDLTAEWSLARPNQRFMPLEDTWNDSWSIGLTAGWRLFDGSRTASEVARMRSERDALRAERDEVERQIELAVEQAHLELQSSLATIAAADAATRAASARELASRERYEAGMAPIAEVLDAQAELSRAERDQTRSRATAWIARAQLDHAVSR